MTSLACWTDGCFRRGIEVHLESPQTDLETGASMDIADAYCGQCGGWMTQGPEPGA